MLEYRRHCSVMEGETLNELVETTTCAVRVSGNHSLA
jgi:hypothetical protein